MTDTRTTQAGAIALTDGPAADTRITQTGAQALVAHTSPSVRVSQAGAQALIQRTVPGLYVSQVGALVLADYYPCLTHYAQCWRIKRLDGEIFAYTAADVSISFGGDTYMPCESLNASANELGAALGQIGNTQISGIISDDGISEADIIADLFDQAVVEIWMVPWNGGSEAPWRITKGQIAKTTHGRAGYEIEVLTPGAMLQQKSLLRTCGPGCGYDLGDDDCRVDLYAYQEAGTVTTISALNASLQASERIFIDSSRSEADGYWEGGLIEWQTGANAGQISEVKDFVPSTGQITLWDALISPIAIGDTYIISPGCDKSFETCKAKFANGVNFGGFPHLPGQDAISQTPEAKAG